MEKTKKSLVCLSCGHEHENKWYKMHPPLSKKKKRDVKLTKEYCKEQVIKYNHENCKAIWCDECQVLKEYLVNY